MSAVEPDGARGAAPPATDSSRPNLPVGTVRFRLGTSGDTIDWSRPRGVSIVTIETHVAEHYTQGTLEQRILTALREAGKDPDRLDPDDLAPVDGVHPGGRSATAAFAPRLKLRPGIHLLEIGSGIGGPARYFARYHGCRVTGIDLTEEFIVVSRALTRRLGMTGG